MNRLFAATLLVSASAIAYEILLMRMLSIVQWHHFAYMIISLALLGYGASGTFIALARPWLEPRFGLAFGVAALLLSLSMIGCFALGQRVPFNALEIVWAPQQLLYLGVVYMIFFLPFFFAACCIGLAFSFRGSQISRIYFFDLFGAGLGAILVIVSLYFLSPHNVLILLAALALCGSVLMADRGRRMLLLPQAAWLLVLLIGLPPSWLGMRVSEYKGLSQAMQVIGSRVLSVSSSPLGLLTVVESPQVPFRHAPGLSVVTRFEPPEQLAVFTDGDGMSVITRHDAEAGDPAYLQDLTTALPFALLDTPRVLVLGAGGGTDVLMALHHGAASVDAVELNPQMTELVAENYADFAGHLYQDERVRVHTGEARGFVARSQERYDLIQIALLDSFAASGSGVQALSESYLYTVDAIGEFLQHLAPDGLLAVTRWLKLPPRDSLKLVATVIAALREAGVDDPGRRIAMIRSWNTSTLLVKNGEFTGNDVAAIREFARSRSFDTAWYPTIRADAANRFNLLAEPFLHDGIDALLGADAEEFLARYKFDISPATDDRPYFFHFFRWSALPEVLDLRKRGGASLIEWGYLILLATLLQAVLAGALLILLPLSRIKRTWAAGTGPRMGSYFFLLGLAFLFVEIAFIQRFVLFLSHPLYAVAVVLAGFLVFAGLGSIFSEPLRRRIKMRGYSAVTVAVIGIAVIALFYLGTLPLILARLIGLGDVARIAVSLSLIAPLAFFMGMPFPLALSRLSEAAPDFVPWAWGINGFASVISAAGATLLAIEFGFTTVILAAVVLYASAARIWGRTKLGSGKPLTLK